jgi:hypothetical protein
MGIRKAQWLFFLFRQDGFFKIGSVPNGILVGEGSSVQCAIVTAGCPAVYFLGDDVMGRSPGAIRTPRGAISEYLLELGFRDSEAVWCLPPWARSYRWSRRAANVMDCRMPRFPGNTCRSDNIRKILEQAVIAISLGENFNVAAECFHLGAIYCKVSDVVEASVNLWNSLLTILKLWGCRGLNRTELSVSDHIISCTVSSVHHAGT